MKRNWTFAVVALVLSAAAVVTAFIAGKKWGQDPDDDFEEDLDEYDDKDPDETDINENQDGKK